MKQEDCNLVGPALGAGRVEYGLFTRAFFAVNT